MGETASQYPETLVNIAKLAFTRRPALSLRLILHGRAVSQARKPRCDACVLADICPSAFTF